MDQFEKYLQFQKEVAQAAVKVVERFQTSGGERSHKRTSNIDEAFVNFGCIATGILQVLARNYHETIWKRYMGWLRTVSSTIPSEEVVQSVIQQEHFHNFSNFRTDAIYRITAMP
jgi:hypothetical protein